MSIDQLSTLLDEIKGYVDDYKLAKEENLTLKEQVSNIRAEVEAKYLEQINALNVRVAELEEQANLNLSKAQEIVNELKEIVNA